LQEWTLKGCGFFYWPHFYRIITVPRRMLGEGRILNCFNQNGEEFTETCQAAIDESVVREQ